MKYLSIVAMVSILLLTGCVRARTVDDPSETSSDDTSSFQDTSFYDKNINFNVYSFEDDDFKNFVLNNSIDSSYIKEYPSSGVTREMMEYESKYANIWKAEMEDSCKKLSLLLNDEDKEKFLSLQNDWQMWLDNSLTFEFDVLTKQEYEVNMGSLFLVSQRAAYKEAFRERTLKIKYNHHLLEAYGKDAKSLSDCESLKFLFGEGN